MPHRSGRAAQSADVSGLPARRFFVNDILAVRPAGQGPEKRSCANCPMRGQTPCAALDDAELFELDAIKSYRRLAPHQTLVVEGERADHAYNVMSGGLKLIKSLPDGRTQITGLLLPGDFLGIPPRGIYLVSAEALPDTELCSLPKGGLEAVLARHSRLKLRVLGEMYDELAAAQDHMLLLGRKSALERVCSFIRDLVQRLEGTRGTIELFRIPLQRIDIADYLGLTQETVSRIFTQLHREGIIRLVKANRIAIANRPTLEAIAAGGSHLT